MWSGMPIFQDWNFSNRLSTQAILCVGRVFKKICICEVGGKFFEFGQVRDRKVFCAEFAEFFGFGKFLAVVEEYLSKSIKEMSTVLRRFRRCERTKKNFSCERK